MASQKNTRSQSTDWNRREFLKIAALSASPLPGIFVSASQGLSAEKSAAGKTLVVLELAGGNDGLNTVIPIEDSRYYNARPALSVGKSQALKMGKDALLGFHPVMDKFHELYDEGKVTVINNVGYPNSNRSHFRSAEIWHTARPESESTRNGWLGRTLKSRNVGALVMGDDSPPLALAEEGVQVPALQNLDWLDTLFSSSGRELRSLFSKIQKRRLSGDLGFLQGATQATFTQLGKLEKIRNNRPVVEYPNSYLAKKLEWTGQLIAGDYPSKIFYTRMPGFDTHARQKESHERLLAEFSNAVAAFQNHMEKVGKSKEVVLVAFSEFGRRVQENGSQGTDHGSAGPVFVVSGSVQGGMIGNVPDLANLYRGDVKFDTDFRSVYATLLDQVVGVSSKKVLGKEWDQLKLFTG